MLQQFPPIWLATRLASPARPAPSAHRVHPRGPRAQKGVTGPSLRSQQCITTSLVSGIAPDMASRSGVHMSHAETPSPLPERMRSCQSCIVMHLRPAPYRPYRSYTHTPSGAAFHSATCSHPGTELPSADVCSVCFGCASCPSASRRSAKLTFSFNAARFASIATSCASTSRGASSGFSPSSISRPSSSSSSDSLSASDSCRSSSSSSPSAGASPSSASSA